MLSPERCGWLKCQGYEQKHYRQGLQTFVDCKSLSCLKRSSHCLTPSAGVCCGCGAVKAWNPSQTVCSSPHLYRNTSERIPRHWIVFWASHSPGRCVWYQQMNTRVTGDERRKARSTLSTAFQKNCLKIIVILLSDLKYPHLRLTKTEA